jgi:hypothetical protein
MSGHRGTSGEGEGETEALSASQFQTASMLRYSHGYCGLRGPAASFGPHPPEVPFRTLTYRGC